MNQLLPILQPQPRPREAVSLIDAYLREQQRLPAVDRFAHYHSQLPRQAEWALPTRGGSATSDGGQSPPYRYRDLIPSGKPGDGQQYAFEVDLDACSGCKSCVAACHSLNGLDDDESWRNVGLLVGGSTDSPVMQHVTSSCHHCIEPACLSGCPVNAYEKDPITGIVRHLDDQCIGCQYCILKCPYDVPRYNSRLGIVRKCDMCSDRLASGEAPACAQSCPNSAIRITLVDQEGIVEESRPGMFVPGAAEPDYTLPTTHYKTRRVLPRNVLPADHHVVQPQHAHMPLAIMLVLTQLSVGAFCLGNLFPSPAATQRVHGVLSLALALIALAASVLHLGRPLYAFRAVIGLRTSWLSREILAFSLFAVLAAAYALITPGAKTSALGWIVTLVGLAGVACSVMIYHDTRRPSWHLGRTGTKFVLTCAVLGCSTLLLSELVAMAAMGGDPDSTRPGMERQSEALCRLLMLGTALKLSYEALFLVHLKGRKHSPLRRSAMLLTGALRRWTQARFALGVFGGLILPSVLFLSYSSLDRSFDSSLGIVLIAAMFAATLAGELLERRLFFTAAIAPKMPGGIGE